MAMPESTQYHGELCRNLDALPYPVYFVHPYRERWADCFNTTQLPDPDLIYWRFAESNDVWVANSYLQLRKRGLDVRFASRLVPGAINVIMNYDLGIRQQPYHSYVVACRGDTYHTAISDHTVVQNQLNVLSATDHLIQHWPQPGLIRRDPSRGSRLETVAYMGHRINLWDPFREPAFQEKLKEMGVTFRMNETTATYHDYSDCDATLAVRDLTQADFRAKPASKLINSWHAGVPALLGPEPAFQALRRTHLDFIEIWSPEDAIGAIARLKNDPTLYREMVENGFMRAREFTVDRIAARWREVLAGPVARGFSDWARRPALWKSLVRPVVFAVQAARHVHERRDYRSRISRGFRPVSGRHT